jgi:2-hydroxymuconate-semialdehyde hydrolase
MRAINMRQHPRLVSMIAVARKGSTRGVVSSVCRARGSRQIAAVGACLAAMIWVCAVGGCASKTSLAREADSPTLGRLLAERRSLVSHTRLVPTVREGREIRLAVHEKMWADAATFAGTARGMHELMDGDAAGSGERALRLSDHPRAGLEAEAVSRVVVLIHGMLADARSFRFIEAELARLAPGVRLVLVELPGCGESEVPEAEGFPPADATTDALADRVLQAVEPVMGDWGQAGTPATLVGHSLGGAIALRMMCDEELRGAERYEAMLDRVDSLVLISAVDVAVPTPPASVLRFLSTPEWQFSLGSVTGYIKSQVEAETKKQASSDELALAEEAETRRLYIEDSERRRVMKRMFLGAMPLTADQRPDWQAIEKREADYARLDDRGPVPTLLIYGQRDEIVPVATGHKLDAQLPDSWLVTMRGVKHSPQIERAEATAGLIGRFIAGEREGLAE